MASIIRESLARLAKIGVEWITESIMDPEILTIGYGGKKPEKFFAELESYNADFIVDVRENPFKAFLGVYSQRGLQAKLGKKYVWIKELGNRTRDLPPSLVDEEEGLKKLRNLMKGGSRIILLCAEKDEIQCHRSYIKAMIQALLKNNRNMVTY